MLTAVSAPGYQAMLAMPGAERTRSGWAAEPKLDGWRAIVTVDDGLEVRSRTGRFISHIVPELEPLTELGFRTVLDGELVAFDERGTVDFYALSQRMMAKT